MPVAILTGIERSLSGQPTRDRFLRRKVQKEEGKMTLEYGLGLFAAVVILAYLVYVLIMPDKF